MAGEHLWWGFLSSSLAIGDLPIGQSLKHTTPPKHIPFGMTTSRAAPPFWVVSKHGPFLDVFQRKLKLLQHWSSFARLGGGRGGAKIKIKPRPQPTAALVAAVCFHGSRNASQKNPGCKCNSQQPLNGDVCLHVFLDMVFGLLVLAPVGYPSWGSISTIQFPLFRESQKVHSMSPSLPINQTIRESPHRCPFCLVAIPGLPGNFMYQTIYFPYKATYAQVMCLPEPAI